MALALEWGNTAAWAFTSPFFSFILFFTFMCFCFTEWDIQKETYLICVVVLISVWFEPDFKANFLLWQAYIEVVCIASQVVKA